MVTDFQISFHFSYFVCFSYFDCLLLIWFSDLILNYWESWNGERMPCLFIGFVSSHVTAMLILIDSLGTELALLGIWDFCLAWWFSPDENWKNIMTSPISVFVLFCFVLFCFVLFCFVLFCFVLFCFVLFLFCFSFFLFYFFYFERPKQILSYCSLRIFSLLFNF